jgi:uncharacterized protein
MITLLIALLVAVAVPPKPAAYVTDKTGVLDTARVHALNEKLAQFERGTSNQVLVYVDRDLPADSTIEQFANDAMHQWGVGQKGKDNGAVLFLFTGNRKMRIEVGYGLESVLTDAKARDITSTIIKPRLKAADYDGAVEQGADAMLAVIRGEGLKGTGRTVRETRHPVSPVQTRSWTGLGLGELVVVVALCVVLPVMIVILLVIVLVRGGRRTASRTPMTTYVSDSSDSSSSSSWSSFSSSDSSSSSSSDSGFDGGGGDSGGGGASDSW